MSKISITVDSVFKSIRLSQPEQEAPYKVAYDAIGHLLSDQAVIVENISSLRHPVHVYVDLCDNVASPLQPNLVRIPEYNLIHIHVDPTVENFGSDAWACSLRGAETHGLHNLMRWHAFGDNGYRAIFGRFGRALVTEGLAVCAEMHALKKQNPGRNPIYIPAYAVNLSVPQVETYGRQIDGLLDKEEFSENKRQKSFINKNGEKPYPPFGGYNLGCRLVSAWLKANKQKPFTALNVETDEILKHWPKFSFTMKGYQNNLTNPGSNLVIL